jgi:hypothetical protein
MDIKPKSPVDVKETYNYLARTQRFVVGPKDDPAQKMTVLHVMSKKTGENEMGTFQFHDPQRSETITMSYKVDKERRQMILETIAIPRRLVDMELADLEGLLVNFAFPAIDTVAEAEGLKVVLDEQFIKKLEKG